MSRHPLADIAWAVHDLVRSEKVMYQFQVQRRAYVDGRGVYSARQALIDLLRNGKQLTLNEKYALLAALHDVVCTSEPKIGPEPGQNCDAPFEEIRNSVRWDALLDTMTNWPKDNFSEAYDPEDSCGDYSGHVRSWLVDVQADLESTGLQDNGARAKTNSARRGRPRGSETREADLKLWLDYQAAHRTTGISKPEFVHERGLDEKKGLAALERGRKVPK